MISIFTEKERAIFYKNGLKFQCTGCGSCCRIADGLVVISPEELREIARFMGISRSELREKYLVRDGRRWLIAENEHHHCIFLQGDQCGIYPVRPRQCQTFPFWPENVQNRKSWEALKAFCPGIDQGRLYTAREIQEIVDVQVEHDEKMRG